MAYNLQVLFKEDGEPEGARTWAVSSKMCPASYYRLKPTSVSYPGLWQSYRPIASVHRPKLFMSSTQPYVTARGPTRPFAPQIQPALRELGSRTCCKPALFWCQQSFSRRPCASAPHTHITLHTRTVRQVQDDAAVRPFRSQRSTRRPHAELANSIGCR